MKFSHSVVLQATPDELFALVSDIERVAPCLPGASVDGRDGDDYNGSMKVRVGPVTAAYAGKLHFVELDAEARRAVMSARADETNGNGGVEAQIVTAIAAEGNGSRVQIDTDLQITGRVAQLGRGAMEKISERMLAQFAQNLEQALSGDAAEPAGPSQAAAKPAAAAPSSARAGELNALALVADTLRDEAKGTLVPAVIGGLVGALIGLLLSRPRRQR
jgi:carbon monoxide dehydrogenase subunit G